MSIPLRNAFASGTVVFRVLTRNPAWVFAEKEPSTCGKRGTGMMERKRSKNMEGITVEVTFSSARITGIITLTILKPHLFSPTPCRDQNAHVRPASELFTFY